MKIETSAFGPFETNLYFLTDEDTKHCILIDVPPGSSQVILNLIESRGLILDAIFLTHGHWDHNGDVARVLSGISNSPMVVAHKADLECHQNPEKYKSWYQMAISDLTDEHFQAFTVTKIIQEDESFECLNRSWKAFWVPGHCPGSLIYYCPSEKAAWTGDVIFQESIGRTDLPGGNFAELESGIKNKIYTLPENVILFPGHGPKTSVGVEKKENPYVRP